MRPSRAIISRPGSRALSGLCVEGECMRFYNLEYILSHQSFDLRLRAAFIIFFLILAVAFSSVYVRNRIKTRWRDVGIGMLVLTLILLGVQVENYSQVSLRSSQSQMLVKFIEGVATDQGVSTDEVLVNSTSLADGMIVRFKGEDYLVHLNDDNNSFSLERTHIIDHNVYVNQEG